MLRILFDFVTIVRTTQFRTSHTSDDEYTNYNPNPKRLNKFLYIREEKSKRVARATSCLKTIPSSSIFSNRITPVLHNGLLIEANRTASI